MSFLLKDRIHTSLVDSVYNDVLSKRSNYYYYIGRVLEWDEPLNPPPPLSVDSYEFDTRNNIIAIKKLQPTDVSYVVKRIDWIADSVYDQFDGEYSSTNPAYSGATSLRDSKFYVLNSEFNVYKCLNNFNNSPSTVEPSGTETTPLTTLDGYVWKYMYTIPLSLRNRFLTNDLMPVTRANLNRFFSRGEIDNISILNRGSGYSGISDVLLVVDGQFDETLSNITINFEGEGYFQEVSDNTTVVIETFGNFQPTVNATANLSYTDNVVTGVFITNRGNGYSPEVQANTFANVITSGNTQPSINANLNINFSVNSVANIIPVFNILGSIVGAKIVNGGSNYKQANISVIDNFGTGESLYKNLNSVTINNSGGSYFPNVVANTTVSIVTSGNIQPTTNALVDLVFTDNSLVEVVIVNSGSNYNNAVIANTTVSIQTSGNAQPTTNANITLNFSNTAIFTPVLNNGVISNVIINDPGINYSSNIQTKLVLIGDGINAQLTPFINEVGEIEDVVIERRGEGYTYLDVEVVGSGSGANILAFFSDGDLDTVQGLVELTAIDGGIHSFRIEDQGINYSTANIIVTGDGTGFVGEVKLSNSSTISHIEVIIPGSGYTFASVHIVGNGSNAVVTPIFSPAGGHGKDAVSELFSDTIGFYSTINNEEIHGVNVNNDYRQFGLLKNVKQYGIEKTFEQVTGTPTFLITLDTVVNLLSNVISSDTVLELVSDQTRKFIVVETIQSTNQILVVDLNNYLLRPEDVLKDPVTDSNFTVLSINKTPSINKFSGDLLFIDNRTSASYSDQQLVTLKTFLKL